jgi:PHD/YefM family antitoxin component YafN of YafNO toxin-antitoxin module
MLQAVQYVTDEAGERKAVLLALEEYERLVEDLADLAVAAERREEPTVPHSQFVEELRRDGLLPG